MNEDNRKRVYDVLKEQTGYLDSYEDFNKAFDASEDNRRRVYDVLKNQTGYLDSYEDFTKGMSAPATSVAQQVIDEYDRSNRSLRTTPPVVLDNPAGSPKIPGYDAVGRLYELMERNKPSLNELVKKNSQDKPESVNDRDTFQTPIYENALRVANRMRKEQAMRSEDYGYRPSIAEPIGRKKNTFEQEEERRIDELYHPKKVENESDVLENYRNRFVLSIRGGKLDSELAEKRGEVEAKYLQAFTQSPEYQDLLRRGASAEEINEKFYQQYGDAINGELRPYENAIFQEMASRYRGRIQEEFTQLQKQRSTDQLKALAGEVDELSKQAHKNLQRRAPSSGNAMNALMGSRNYTQSSEEERRQAGMLNAAKRLIEQSQEIVAEAGKKGGTNFVAGLGRGLRDNMDWENFTFGLADMADALYLNNALEKYEAGNTLSEAEQKLLEASAVNMAIQGFYSSDLGRGYNAGRVTAESLPFMLEFIANPISGSSNAIAKSLLKFGLRRFGRAGSFGARVAGSTGAALGMTGTTGVPRVVSGTMERLNQNYDYYLDENGDLQVQKTGNVGTLEAMGKSIASTALEYQSEMVLNAFRVFRPYLRQLEKALPGGVNSFMQMVKESRPGQLYREVKSNPTLRELVQRTQFQGFPQEYLEEVYSNFSNIPLGDMTLEEATDFDNNLDIILGLTPTFLAFGMIGVGSMATERYQNRKHMERIFGKMTDEQRKKFEELQRMSKINGNEDIKNFIKITMADPELTQEQKRDEIDYAFAIAKQNAMDEIQEAETQDRIDTETEDIAGHSDPSTNTYTEAERIYMNDVGEWVKETGYIVGWQDPEKERFPYWIPEGVEFTPENTRLLRPGEWDATTVKSMPTQEVIDETAQAIREDAAAQAQRESTYSPDIVPPSIGATFTDGAAQYKIAQQNPDNPNGGWLATRTTVDEKGKPKEEVVEITDEQYYNAMQAQIDAQETSARQEQQPVSSTNQAQSNGQSGSETAPSSLQGETSPGASETVIPTDEKGNLLYHRAPVDRTVSSINSEGLEPDEVDAFVQANKDASAKLMRNIKGKAPKMGTNIAQYKKAKQEWQARVDDAQAQVDYWNQVADAIQSQRTQVGDATAEEILSMGEPMDGHELAAQMLATGKLPLLQADFKRETGYKGDEARSLFGFFASEANGGMTIERAGEQLMLADQEAGTNFFDQSDPNAGRNAILDVLSEVRTRGDLTNYIRRNREAMAERERQAEYDAYADWCDREMHMTPEEYEAYQEYVVANNPYEGVAVEELDRIFAEAEEEIQTYLNQQDNGQQGTSENGSSPDSGPSERDEPAGAAGSRKAGVSVLPEAQPVLPGQVQGRTEGTASQPGPADDGVRAEEGTVSEGTSGGEGIENQINDENNGINVVSSQSNQNDTENEQGEVAGISGESRSLDGENEAATILRRAGDRTAASDGRGSWTKESLLGDVVRRSKESQTWIEDIQSIAGKHLLRGGENDVYLSNDGKSVIKVNDFSYLPDNSTNFDSFMNRVDAHNELFPNDAITVLGFTRNSEGMISVVLSQPYISNAREATQEEIDNFLEGMDFYTDMSGNWTDGTFDIADTKPNNVLVDADGNLHFIDVLPYDSRKPGKMLVIPPTRNAFVAPDREEGENLLDYAERVVKTKEIDDARKEVEANPTDAQKEAGNYRKGHITLDGYDITIENPKRSTRSGVDANGQSWSVTMNNDYGYIRGTEGVDGDHIDVFLSDDPTTGKVYVIDQVNADGSFDEHKVMYGFKSALAAKRAYLANYSPGWKGLGTISEISKEEFKKWIESSHRKTKPFAEYKSVKVAEHKSNNRLVTDERYAELKKRMQQKLRGQMNMGIDPEILAIGTEMAVYHIEKGARKFAEYAKAMIADLGDAIRPYLKSFYNGARDLPEVQEARLTDDMDSYDEVSRFDVANFDKDVPNVLDMAETIAKEQEVQAQAGVAKEKIARKRASKKKVKDKSVPLSLNDLFTQTEESNEQGSTEPDSSLGGRARQETERTEQRGTGGSVHGHHVPDEDGSRRVLESAGTSSRQPIVRNQRNYRFGEEGIQVPQGDIAKLKANVEAIRTLKEIEASGQPATEEQKEILSRYVGWGGLADALNEDKYNARNTYYKDANWNSKYLPYYEQLRELLNEEEFQSAVQSTTTSHYTPTPVIRALWSIVQRSGFRGGVVSEPAMGVGHIIGLMPAELSAQSRIGGYEIDSLSGRIASHLYPDADVKVQGYETNFIPQSKDLVITNVPFGRNAPYDRNLDRSLKRELGNAYNLHNYFIAKSLLELKEGGLGVFVTSSATMDGSDSHFREFVVANNIDLVGAIRLPNNAFLQNAGTSVTADILVFRKRKSGELSNGIGFVSTTQIGEGTYEENGETRTKPILVNEYFAEHPDMMLGDMMTAFDAGSGGLYSGASQTLKPKDGANLAEELNKAIAQLPENILSKDTSIVQMQEREVTSLKNGTITTKGGKVYVAVNGELAPVETKDTFTFNGKERNTADAVEDYNVLKDTLKKLIAAEQSEEEDPKSLRKQLNEQYDAFVAKYGTLNRNKPLDDVFAEDYEHNLPLSLEEVSRVPSATGKKMVWQVKKGKGILERRVSYPINEPTTADSLQDAVNISLSYKGTLDIPYIARLMDETEEQVTDEILEQGVAYRDPITGALIDRDTYLSGNVREKLEEARAAAESNPGYQKNVEDLMAVQPETIRFGDISYRLGTPWIPTEYINDFAESVLGITSADVSYEPLLNEFVVSRRAHITDFAKSGLFKTERMGTIDLFVNALNQRKPKIYDEQTTYGPTGKSTTRVPNEAETQAASEKIMEISDKFIEYIDGRNEIHRELERIYNDKYNNYRLKKYSLPSFSHTETDKKGNKVVVTHYPGSNESISLREHQAKAVQRSLYESTLLAHQVGTGKTFTMITTAMEMRRLGLARKPMIVVQNATLEDFVKDFYRLYPAANVLAPSKDERSAENRKRLFNLIATGDFDAIVIPQSFLAFIPDDEGRKKELIQKRIDEYLEAIAKTDDYALQRRLQKEMQGLRENLEGGDGKKSKKSNVKEKAKAADRAKSRAERVLDRRTDDVMNFEKLGIDALFIDEAHNFKKIGFATKMNNVKGVDSGASQRANSLLLKARWVQEKNGGRNVILATGTPITNTMAEVWTMMNFVSPDILDAYNIRSFDDFATTFGTVEPSLEFTATGNFKIADRFKSYVNVPELLKAFRSHADVVLTEDVKEFQQDKNIPKLADGKMENIVIDKNEDLQDVMDMLVRELEDYNKLTGQAKREKSALPLVVFTKAKQAAIDLRLLNPSYADNPNSKTNQVVRNIIKLYKESTPDKGTQLVFCDSYQSPGERPKMDLFDYDPDVPRFNLYEDMKEKLVAAGIPAKEIAIVNNYDGDRRKSLFEKVRNGDVRILLGSTEKMGVGVNVQDRLFALHHVDAPLRPMDFEQRNGRILRQGNLYATWDKPVHVLTYGVQGTLDATAYDRLRVKQEFINQMMKGNTDSRVMEEQDDEDPSGMTFSQMAATLSGDKTAQLLFAAQNKLKRLRNSKRSDTNSKSAMADSVESAKRRIKLLQESKNTYEKAARVVDEYFPNGVKKVEVNGHSFIEKLGPSLDSVIDGYDEAYSLNRGIAPLKLNLNDGAAEVVVHFNEGRMVYELYAGKEHIVEGRQFNGGRGLMSSIGHQLDVIKKNLADTESNIQEQEKKIEGLTKAMNTPWGREEELKEAEKEVEDLQKQLEEKAKENSKERKEVFREGIGSVTGEELANTNDPISKMLGQSTRTARQRQAFAERERGYMVRRAENLARKLHLDNVEIVTDANTLGGRRAKAKGFYNPVTGKITIVIPNHTSEFDVAQTLLHEAVAHYGLRRLFGEHFDTFLDNVFNSADLEVRRKIVELAKKNGWNPRLATEEYLASLAENTNFENLNASWWRKIKELFLRMLHKIGFNDFNGVTLSDNELRYILWRSYENLAEPGRYRSILGEAADVVKQHELKVGNYAQVPAETDHAAEEANDLYRETPDGEASDDGSREAYNRAVAGNRFKAQEAYQDSMLALKRLQEVVEKFSGNKLKSYENAYMAENQMSSKSTREAEVYGQKFFKPMLQEVATLMKQGAGYPEIIDYMIAKHGLERNEVFAERDATQEAERRFEKSYKELEQLYKLGNITQDDYEKRKIKIDTEKEEYYQKRLAQHLEEDYSGLTALAEKYDEADKGFKANAKDMVNDFEGRFDTRALWERVNAATKETLRKSYESGMMSRDTYDKVSKMFNHYIPLRGWDVDTAEDVFEYLNSETSPVNSVLKSAKGRRSMSDDPLATIGNMAESAILQGNRNLMKQNFLNMAINHPTDVLTVREAWYVKDPNTGEWILSFPNIEENDDADAIARKVEEHEERMNMLKENGEATKVKEGLNIDYRISARQAKEHIVNVKRNGKDYLVFVNGNPRAAQAVNGMTNPSVETNKLLEGISRFNRQLAANFTNRNPAFVLSNLSRDLIFAVSAVNIKEGGTYARRFATNIPRAMRVIARNLRGKGDANHADDALFEEFLNNGGETGYTSLHSVDEYKRMVSRELNKITGKRDYFRAVRASAQFFSMMNRWAEDVSRFTTYMTSREQGKTISESVNDAKEVTVNFNKKGAGAKTSGVFGWTSGLFRNLYLFFNAAVQSLANFTRLAKKNPKAFYTTLGGFTTAGFLVPMLNGIAISMLGGDDDEDYYGNLPEWVRRNNLCLYAGNGKFITIPLPIELRAFYGLGEMAYQATVGKDETSGDRIAYQAINQITELLPINPLGNNGDLVTTLMPDVLSPFWQIYENKDFTGKPIYRQNAFNETMPEWTKAYNSTSDWLVKLSEWANELAGGDKYKQADVMEPIMNWNPAKVEHLFESYFGGMAKTFNQAAKTLAGGVESVLQGEKSDDLQWYNTPVLNRFINDASDDRSAFSKVNERYYRLYDLYEEVGKELRGYGREAARGDLDYLDKLNRLYQSDDYKKYLIFKGNKRIIDRIRDMEKRLPEESTKEKEDLQKRVAEMKRSLLEQIDGIK